MAETQIKDRIIRVRLSTQRMIEAQTLGELNGENLSALVRRWIDAGYEADIQILNASSNTH